MDVLIKLLFSGMHFSRASHGTVRQFVNENTQYLAIYLVSLHSDPLAPC